MKNLVLGLGFVGLMIIINFIILMFVIYFNISSIPAFIINYGAIAGLFAWAKDW